MGNESEVSIRFNNEIKNQNKLKEYVEQLKTIKAFASALDKKTIADVNVAASNIKNVGAKMNTAFNLLGAREFTRAMQRLVKTMGDFVGKSSDYLENINLFQVAFDGNYKSADRFIKKMSEMYGMDESWLTRTVGIFRQLSNAMNLSAENGERLSTLMTQMSLDISSLYNIDVEKASSTLQSALAGQTKPIRGATGADITQATLQTTLGNIGIDRQVAQLSYAEKRLLIIISLTQQLNESIGDMGRTIESPANQTRVLKEQWERLSRAVGNVFLPIMAKILPYLNAILMVLTEIINMIASLFGFKLEDYDYFAGTADSVLDLEDALGGAASNAKDLKKAMMGLRGFDKLNVIRTPSASSGGGGVGGGISGTGISGDILKAFNKAYDDYQKKLENIKMKAQEIKEQILETLGFHKEMNYETGEWEWKYDGVGKTVKNLWNAFWKLSPQAKLVAEAIGLIAGAVVIKGLRTVVKLLGKSGALGAITGLLSPLAKIVKNFKELSGEGIKSFLVSADVWKEEAGLLERIAAGFKGIVTSAIGLTAVSASMRSINEDGMNLYNTLGMVAGSLASIVGGVQLGASIGGGYGAIIGGIAGAVGALTVALSGLETENEKMIRHAKEGLEEVKETEKKIAQSVYETEQELIANMSVTNYHEKLAKELESILDKNGNIKKGYEDRAKFILNELSNAYGVEYELVGNTLKEHKKVVEELKNKIALKETEYILEARKEEYLNALKRENELYSEQQKHLEKYNAAQDKTAAAEEKYNKLLAEKDKHLKDSAVEWDIYSDKIIAAKNDVDELKKAEEIEAKAYKIATKNYETNSEIKMNYSDLVAAVETGNMSEIEAQRDKLTRSWVKDDQVMTRSQEEETQKRIDDYATELNIWKKRNDERYSSYVKNLTDMSNYTEGVSDDFAEKWSALGNISEKEFITSLSAMNRDVQEQIVKKMYNNGYKISDELQKGLDSLNLSKTILLKGDDSSFKKTMNSVLGAGSKWGDLLRNIGFNIPKKFASGGLPQVGQLFVANERGPELVGQIGGQSFVANQNQMMDMLDKKIGNVQSNAPQVFNIYLDENHKIGTYTLEQLQGMAKTNGKPITIS